MRIYAVTFPKMKLLVILGAGSSMPCGMPSVADLDTKMKEWCREWREPPYISEAVGKVYCRGPGVYNDIWGIIEKYYRNSLNTVGWHRDVNFENVLGEMIALAHWVTPAPLGNPLTRAVRDRKLSPPLSDAPYNIVQDTSEFGHLGAATRRDVKCNF